MRRLVSVVPLVALLAVPAGVTARNHSLWATIDLCNTSRHPNMMGVRGQMPGNGSRERMYMRFTAQYRAADSSWKTITGTGRSPWIYAGSARFRYEQAGFTFRIDPLKAGDRFVLRGSAEFQWRAKRRRDGKVRVVVVKDVRLHTEAGHPTSASEPAGYSSAACVVENPSS